MPNPFSKRMAQLSDRQLLRVMAERGDYVPEALRAAEAEIARREIPMEVVDAAIEVGKEVQEKANSRKDIPLDRKWQILYFLFAPLALTPMVAFFYRYHAEKDYDRRSWTSLEMLFLGLLTYFALFRVATLLWGPLQSWPLFN